LSSHTDSAEKLDFRRQYRLLTPGQYSEVFSARRVLRGAHFALHYRRNGLPGCRLGLVIPKKQARTAVLRNAIKRQAREFFRRHRAGLPALDLVLRLAQPFGPGGRSVIDKQAKVAWRAEIATLFDKLCRNEAKSGPKGDELKAAQ
jgi:ribonuclease P protein component